MKDICTFIQEAKQKTPYSTKDSMLLGLYDWAIDNDFDEVNYASWYTHCYPKKNTVERDNSEIRFNYGNGRYICLTSDWNGKRKTIKNTLLIKVGSISCRGYSMAEEFEIDLLNGGKWISKPTAKKTYNGCWFDPSALEPSEVKKAFDLITELVINKQNIDIIFDKFYVKDADGNYVQKPNIYKTVHAIKLSDIKK